LRAKLQRGEEEADGLIEALIATLAGEGLLSDRRFTETFVRSRLNRGQGPLRIEADLRQRGVSAELIERCLAGAGEEASDWSGTARAARRKRFGAEVPGDFSERARQARFLRSRGFTERQIREAFADDDELS
jgi:regulatory protein